MLRHLLAERETELPYFTIGKLLALLEKGGALSLGPGEPDFPASPKVRAAAKQAMDRKETHYSPPQGRKDLREALARKLWRENRIRVPPDDVLVTTGSTEGVLLALLATMDPGEGILVPDPSFLAYKPTVEILNGMPLAFPLREEEGFRYTTEALEEALIPEKTTALILNSPCNPTGTVLSRRDLEEVAAFAVEHDLLIIADEAYERFVYGTTHVSIGSLNGMHDRVVTLHSFSKTHAMPGFRVGYACGPGRLIQAMTKLHLFTSLATPTVSQAAALAALRDQAYPAQMLRAYAKRRQVILRRARELLPVVEPKGAFYVFPSIRATGLRSLPFAEQLLKKAKVAVVPGTEFGKHGEGFIRLSYATDVRIIGQAMDRMEQFLKGLR
ncbi:MAG: pyridoxal phosphate-dependent aminotransferase [Candidatus Aenigmarchaeota archaeon]|nr:pyridoxal phosphate-dependent aminotransferase [Candidatus Aenigmarchaeota archaeon]